MPEMKPLPCPHCGSENIHVASTRAMYVIACYDCSMAGPCSDAQEAVIPAWNALPRALTWTTEPPKVAGWYWRKETPDGRMHVFHFTGDWNDYGEHWDSDRAFQLGLCFSDNLWAGPIPTPSGAVNPADP